MSMRDHIIAAMREMFDRWEALLAPLNEGELTSPLHPWGWTILDNMSHLMMWQSRSIILIEAALADRVPVFPTWLQNIDPDVPGAGHQINAWIYEQHKDRPWSQVYRDWREGYLRFLDRAAQVSEHDFLDGSRYAWMEGYPVAMVVVSSYEHHLEHYEMVEEKVGGEPSPPPPLP